MPAWIWLRGIGVIAELERLLPHPQPVSHNHHTPLTKALGFIHGLLCGAEKLTQMAYLRHDPVALCAYNLCVGLQRRLGTAQRAELHPRLFGCAAGFSRAHGQATLKLAVTGKRAREWWLAVFRHFAGDGPDCDAVGGLAARSARFFLQTPPSTA